MTQVLIVGAGPTGLTLANLLAKLKVDFMIIDKKSSPTKESKAFGIHARSLEIFQRMGIAEEALAAGNTDITVHVFRKNKAVAKFSLQNILNDETPFPHLLILPQSMTEQLLAEALEDQNQNILWEHELLFFTREETGYTTQFKTASGNVTTLHTTFIVGCDGADSMVRKKGNFDFIGKSFKPYFSLADATIKTPLNHGNVYLLLSPMHLSLLFSYKKMDSFRLFNFVNSTFVPNQKEGLYKEDVQSILNSNPYIKAALQQLGWSSKFKIHSRLADKFQKDNIFLAGDAAHVHSPVGAQGMNTGIQDAYNLAWKLSLVLSQKAKKELLNTYHEERYPIARRLYYSTDIFFQWLTKKNKMMDFFRMNIFPYVFRILSIRLIRKKVFRMASQISVNYRGSSLSMATFHPFFLLKAGDRARWAHIYYRGKTIGIFELFDERYFTLIITSPDDKLLQVKLLLHNLQKLPTLPVKVHYLQAKPNRELYKKYGIINSAMILVRPDGHISFSHHALDIKKLEAYLMGMLLIH
ncbi:FAD-dependent monooxygenase [Anditalea andensis]|nr:FAD-dependent monooxygenase [Anditalea andensis]